jgi:hypothetical protein
MTVEVLVLYQRTVVPLVPTVAFSVAALPEHTASPVSVGTAGLALMEAVTAVLPALSQPVAAL